MKARDALGLFFVIVMLLCVTSPIWCHWIGFTFGLNP